MRRILLLAFGLTALVSCGGKKSLPAASASTPVILVSIDTLRSDRLPAYGYTGVETPNIDAFRKDGVLYERAYAHTPLTLPSHASILTGVLPAEHGVRDNLGFPLKESARSVAEVLKASGYATGAAVSAYVLRRESGIARGFDFYDDDVEALADQMRLIGNMQRDGGASSKIASDWIAKQTRPVFFFLHIYEPHTPYAPPEPYLSKYSNRYDGEVAYSDKIFGDFIASLKAQGIYDKALIIVLSDHGEGLNDHGEMEHGLFLYREAIQVPLLVKLPEQAFSGATVKESVQLVDVVPTILERTGVKMQAKLAGVSLTDFLQTQKPAARVAYSETYYPRFHYGWADQHSLVDGDRHYIQSPKPELFDLKSDFGEKKNILTEDRRGFFAMKAAIAPMIQEAAAPSAIDPEEAAKLAALGYLGSTVPTAPGEVLPDPKDNIAAFRDIDRSFQLFEERKYDEALRLIDSLLATNRRIVDLYDLKSKTMVRLGRIPEAVEVAKEGLRLAPTASHLALGVANNQLELGQLDSALQHAELAIKNDPSRAYDALARIWIEKKDLAKAEEAARKALEADRNRIQSLITIARVEREQGKLDSALQHLDRAMQLKKPREEIAGLRFIRGDVYARLGRAEEAEREFREEIRLFPDDPMPYKNLVLLLVAMGRVQEATQLIRQLVDTAPTPPSYLAVCQVLETLGDTRGVRYWARQGLAKYPGNPELRRLAG
jgi:arylsulfatase A-like enzyme/Flp pilus assembly protein TadD